MPKFDNLRSQRISDSIHTSNWPIRQVNNKQIAKLDIYKQIDWFYFPLKFKPIWLILHIEYLALNVAFMDGLQTHTQTHIVYTP